MANRKFRPGRAKRLLRWVLLSAVVLGVDAAAPFATPAAAQSATQTPAQRCSQLIAYYDRFGVGRSLHTDGRRNTTRADAEIDCSRGLYAQGIATMEKLLAAKKFTPPPSGLPDEPDVDE